jgi:hypothetical protein
MLKQCSGILLLWKNGVLLSWLPVNMSGLYFPFRIIIISTRRFIVFVNAKISPRTTIIWMPLCLRYCFINILHVRRSLFVSNRGPNFFSLIQVILLHGPKVIHESEVNFNFYYKHDSCGEYKLSAWYFLYILTIIYRSRACHHSATILPIIILIICQAWNAWNFL